LKSQVDSAITADKVNLVALLSSGLEDSEGMWPKLNWLLGGLRSRGIFLEWPTESSNQYMMQMLAASLTFSQRFSAGLSTWLKLADSNTSCHGLGGGAMIIIRYSIQQLCLYLGIS
jgi:hypothetical protein